MKIIYPGYGTGVLKGIPIKHEDMSIKMLSFLYNDDLLEEWAGSEYRYDLDYLNFADEQEKEPVLNLRWPDQDELEIFCYVGLLVDFEDFNINEFPFSANEEKLLTEFITKFNLDLDSVVDLITIGTEEIK